MPTRFLCRKDWEGYRHNTNMLSAKTHWTDASLVLPLQGFQPSGHFGVNTRVCVPIHFNPLGRNVRRLHSVPDLDCDRGDRRSLNRLAHDRRRYSMSEIYNYLAEEIQIFQQFLSGLCEAMAD